MTISDWSLTLVAFIWPIIFFGLVFGIIPYSVYLQHRIAQEQRRRREIAEQALELQRQILEALKQIQPPK